MDQFTDALTALSSRVAPLPEVTLPIATVDGAPAGLSLVAGPGQDRALLAFAAQVAAALFS